MVVLRRSLFVVLSLFLAGCDFFFATPFPPFFPYVSGEIDVGSRLPDPLDESEAAVITTTNGESYLTLFARGSDGDADAFFVLDADLRLCVAERSRAASGGDSAFVFDGYTVALGDGAIQRGNLLFDPIADTVINAPLPDLSIYPEPPRNQFPLPDGYLEFNGNVRLDRMDVSDKRVDSFDLFSENGDVGMFSLAVLPSGSAYYVFWASRGIVYKVNPWW